MEINIEKGGRYGDEYVITVFVDNDDDDGAKFQLFFHFLQNFSPFFALHPKKAKIGLVRFDLFLYFHFQYFQA